MGAIARCAFSPFEAILPNTRADDMARYPLKHTTSADLWSPGPEPEAQENARPSLCPNANPDRSHRGNRNPRIASNVVAPMLAGKSGRSEPTALGILRG